MWQPSRFVPMDDAVAAARDMVRDVGDRDAKGFEPAEGTAGAVLLAYIAEHGGAALAADTRRAIAAATGKSPRAVDYAADTLDKHGRLVRRQDEQGRTVWALPVEQGTVLDDDDHTAL